MDDLLREFVTETNESLDVVDVELVRFEQEPTNAKILDHIFRLVHTIKGTCGFLNLPRLEALAHAAETLMGKFRSGASPSAEAVTLILATIDRIKGILDVEDARMAAETGADAIIVSNHGGRQLDGAHSSIAMLPRIVDAVGDRIEVHLDGGIRSGQDVLKAVALGAKGTYIGRPFLYGLGAMGQAGVTKALEIIAKEMDITMALCGKRQLADVDKSIIAENPF